MQARDASPAYLRSRVSPGAAAALASVAVSVRASSPTREPPPGQALRLSTPSMLPVSSHAPTVRPDSRGSLRSPGGNGGGGSLVQLSAGERQPAGMVRCNMW